MNFFWHTFIFSSINFNFKGKGFKVSKGVKFVTKVKFVREQRIFAKGSRGPQKKKSTELVRSLRIYISTSGNIQNVPPLSTLLGLYGINVQKFCDDLSNEVKKKFFEGLSLVIQLNITKDLNFTFKILNIRLNYLLQSIDTRIFNTLSLLRTFFKRRLSSFYLCLADNEILGYRDYTFGDIWFTFFFFYLFGLINYASHEAFIRSIYASIKSYRNVYYIKKYIFKSKC
jgi:hypothetical protein